MISIKDTNLEFSDAIKKRRVLILVGPTASGKTPISLLIAKGMNCEIVSADSRQVYRFMDIGTAKPSKDELQFVKHHFIDVFTPDQDYNAGEYGKQARAVIDDIFERGAVPVVVGGSGLYIQALADGFFEGPSADPEIRKKLYQRLNAEGAEKLLNELQRVDPISASSMAPSNSRRIIRALEVYQISGIPLSTLQKSNIPPNFVPCFIGLQWLRKSLYERINRRVDLMFEMGLLDEIKDLQKRGYTQEYNSIQTVGYKEVFDYFKGDYGIEELKELIKRNTRRYAKRQLTWFRADKRIKWFELNAESDFQRTAEHIKHYFRDSAF